MRLHNCWPVFTPLLCAASARAATPSTSAFHGISPANRRFKANAATLLNALQPIIGLGCACSDRHFDLFEAEGDPCGRHAEFVAIQVERAAIAPLTLPADGPERAVLDIHISPRPAATTPK